MRPYQHIVIRRGARSLPDLLSWRPEPCRSDPTVGSVTKDELQASRRQSLELPPSTEHPWDVVQQIKYGSRATDEEKDREQVIRYRVGSRMARALRRVRARRA